MKIDSSLRKCPVLEQDFFSALKSNNFCYWVWNLDRNCIFLGIYGLLHFETFYELCKHNESMINLICSTKNKVLIHLFSKKNCFNCLNYVKNRTFFDFYNLALCLSISIFQLVALTNENWKLFFTNKTLAFRWWFYTELSGCCKWCFGYIKKRKSGLNP